MNSTTSAIPTYLTVPQPDHYGWLILGCFTCLIFPISCFYFLRTTSNGKLYDLGGLPILSAWSFFSKRYDFMRKNLELSKGLPFRFRVLQHRVVAVSGPSGRKVFFNNSSLDLMEGYKILLGGTPKIEDINVPMEATDSSSSEFFKRLHFVLHKDRITAVLPVLLDDLNRNMLDWGREGLINPFKEVNDLVFQMTLRLITCEELCRDQEAAKTMAGLYWNLEKSATATAVLLPWFPSPSRKMNKRASTDLYIFVLKYVLGRRAAGAPTKDAIDVLIQRGDNDVDIVTFVMGTILAGVANTGINTCWALLYLGNHGDWRGRAVSEIQSMLSAHSDAAIDTEPIHKRLASLPLCAWEDELPSLDLIIRETIRISASFTFLRRNLRTDIDADGVRIPKGDFMAYLATDVHMDENVYTNPGTFDPGRYEDGRNEDKSVYCGYLGWGAGRHPCGGIRIAKLEMKVVLAMLLVGYNYTLVDGHGNQTNKLPLPDRNDTLQARPFGKPVYLKFKQMEEMH